MSDVVLGYHLTSTDHAISNVCLRRLKVARFVNASPIILFSRIGRLDLIERLAPTILIPNAVIEEVRAGEGKDGTVTATLERAGKYRVEDVALITSIEHWDLGGAGLRSPIFRRNDPAVLGMLYAAFEGEARLTYALSGHLLQWAVGAALGDGTLNVEGMPSLNEYRTHGHALDAWHSPGQN